VIEHCPFERAEEVTAEFAGGAEQERSPDNVERVAGCPLASKRSSHRDGSLATATAGHLGITSRRRVPGANVAEVRPTAVRPVEAMFASAGVGSLLDRPLEDWVAALRPGAERASPA